MLAGASTIYGPGMLEMGVTFDVAQLVADAEIVAMTKLARVGIPVNDRTTFVDEIISIGAGNEFLSSASSLKGARSLSQTKLIDRQVREAWEGAGSPDYYEQAKKEARRILAEHEIEPLPADVAQEIRSIIATAERTWDSGAA
jgi:trimethylamine--corrinoid protein Co-methyltransferase